MEPGQRTRQSPQTLAFHAGGGSLLLGDGITDDTLLHIACFLTAKDLLCLGLTAARFSIKRIPVPLGHTSGVEQDPDGPSAVATKGMTSIVGEAGRRWMAGRSEQERGWVRLVPFVFGRQSWLGLMDEVEVLRLPLKFGQVHADHDHIALSENEAVATRHGEYDENYHSAGSKVKMCAGHHYAQFTLLAGTCVLVGAVRPGWVDRVETEHATEASEQEGHCFYDMEEGTCWPGGREWKGSQATDQPGDRIGLLLNLDQGSMRAWKNDVYMGVMQVAGLTGPLCWAAEMFDDGDSIRIDSAVCPALPTAEDLAAAAKAFSRCPQRSQ
jgi:hypothetical protein